MKAIELTKSQQDRLIEMADELFPGRGWLFWPKDDDAYRFFGHSKYYSDVYKKTYPPMAIHWLEFMVYHLIPKLTKTYNLLNKINYRPAIDADRNLIDFIYEDYFRVYPWEEEKPIKLRRTK